MALLTAKLSIAVHQAGDAYSWALHDHRGDLLLDCRRYYATFIEAWDAAAEAARSQALAEGGA